MTEVCKQCEDIYKGNVLYTSSNIRFCSIHQNHDPESEFNHGNGLLIKTTIDYANALRRDVTSIIDEAPIITAPATMIESEPPPPQTINDPMQIVTDITTTNVVTARDPSVAMESEDRIMNCEELGYCISNLHNTDPKTCKNSKTSGCRR